MCPTASFTSYMSNNAFHQFLVNLLLSATFNDNLMKGFSVKEKSLSFNSKCNMSYSCILFWSIEVADGGKRVWVSSAVYFSRYDSRVMSAEKLIIFDSPAVSKA